MHAVINVLIHQLILELVFGVHLKNLSFELQLKIFVSPYLLKSFHEIAMK